MYASELGVRNWLQTLSPDRDQYELISTRFASLTHGAKIFGAIYRQSVCLGSKSLYSVRKRTLPEDNIVTTWALAPRGTDAWLFRFGAVHRG